MEVDWERLDYEMFGKIVPKIAQVFFGMNLKFEREPDFDERNFPESFVLSWRQKRALGVVCRNKRLGKRELSALILEILRMQTSAGLIVSASPQPFKALFFERAHGCWFPIAVWGRRHVDAIAGMNSALFSGIIPFVTRLPSRSGFINTTGLGKGGVLASDVVEFVQLGFNVGARIGVNPVRARKKILRDINGCFIKAGSKSVDYWQKVGADGWFHFHKDLSGPKIINLALDCTDQIRRIASRLKRYQGQNLKVAMGINTAEDVQLDPSGGGPLDDDSIVAFRLLKENFRQYDIRATQQAVANLVEATKRSDWTNYDAFPYPDGKQIEVYGHS